MKRSLSETTKVFLYTFVGAALAGVVISFSEEVTFLLLAVCTLVVVSWTCYALGSSIVEIALEILQSVKKK